MLSTSPSSSFAESTTWGGVERLDDDLGETYVRADAERFPGGRSRTAADAR
jgi:hypothetical protein